MPRQKIKPGMREARIEIRVTIDEKRKCEAFAREAGMDLSGWVRQRLMIDRVVQK